MADTRGGTTALLDDPRGLLGAGAAFARRGVGSGPAMAHLPVSLLPAVCAKRPLVQLLEIVVPMTAEPRGRKCVVPATTAAKTQAPTGRSSRVELMTVVILVSYDTLASSKSSVQRTRPYWLIHGPAARLATN